MNYELRPPATPNTPMRRQGPPASADLGGAPTPAPAAADGVQTPTRHWRLALVTVLLAVTMAVLDGSIVNVALPTIATDRGVSSADAVWVVTAYQLAVVVALLPLARLGESIGFRRVYLGGMLTFALASLLCALAPSLDGLVLARGMQGLGAAALMSINGAIIRQVTPPGRLGRSISWIAMVVAVSAAAGPTLAAAILAVSSWHWLFLINVPLTALTFALGYVSLPRDRGDGAGFDFVSAALNAATFGLFIFALASVGALPSTAASVALVTGAVFAGALLLLRQRSKRAPMLPVDLLGRPVFATSILSSLGAFTAQFVALVSLPFYLHDTLGYSAVHTGLVLTAWPAATALASPFVGRLAERHAPTLLTLLGLVVFAVGLGATTLTPLSHGDAAIVATLAVCGVGFALFQTPNNQLLLTTAPLARSGAASGLQSSARLLGQSAGAALASLLLAVAHGTAALSILMWTAAGFAALGAAVCAGRNLALRQGLIHHEATA